MMYQANCIFVQLDLEYWDNDHYKSLLQDAVCYSLPGEYYIAFVDTGRFSKLVKNMMTTTQGNGPETEAPEETEALPDESNNSSVKAATKTSANKRWSKK